MVRTKERDSDIYTCIDTENEFDGWCQEGGWDGIDHFEADTGVTFDELRGQWFAVIMGRVFVEE